MWWGVGGGGGGGGGGIYDRCGDGYDRLVCTFTSIILQGML